MTEEDTSVQNTGTGVATRRTRATAMVEMALVLPVLLAILFAICELSIAMMQWQTLGNAAREGAREGSLFRSSCSSSVADAAADTAADDTLLAAGVTSATVSVSGTCVIPGSTTVTITSPYDFMFLPDFVSGLAPTLNLTSTSVMRNSDLSGTSGSGGGGDSGMGMGDSGKGSDS